MEDLIKALQILQKYGDGRNPTFCGHDELCVYCGISYDMVSEDDIFELERLSFTWSDDNSCFSSYRFGSC